MQNAGFVDRLQTVEQWSQYCLERRFVGLGCARKLVRKRFPYLVLSEHIRRAVRLEMAVDPHDVRMHEPGKRPGFDHELRQSLLKVRFAVFAHRRYDAVRRAPRQIGRKILLEYDVLLQDGVVCEIGDSEAARTQHGLDPVLEQHASGRQCVRVVQLGHDSVYTNP